MTQGSQWGAIWRGVAAGGAALILSAQAWSMSPEAYADLDPEVALQVPMVEALPVFGWSKKAYYFIVENALIDLRYLYKEPTGTSSPALLNAIRNFQSAMQHSPTGSLRVNEFVELVERTNGMWQLPILPPGAAVIREGGVISLEGTWVSDRLRDPDPVQTSQVRCRREAGSCAMATAKVRMNDAEGGWFHNNTADLEVRIVDLKITRWDDSSIEAAYQPYFCVTDTLVVDLRADEARIFRERSDDGACAQVKAGRDTFRLVDGEEHGTKFWEQRKDRAHLLRSRAFRERVEEIQRVQPK